MILNWTGDNLKIIPLAKAPVAGEQVIPASEYITLAPGYNEVPDSDWIVARQWVSTEIRDGRIVEEWTKTPRPEKAEELPLIYLESDDARESKTIRIPSTFRDIQRPRVIEAVIKNTFVIPVLKKWSSEDNRPDVQSALVKQIDAVESGKITG